MPLMLVLCTPPHDLWGTFMLQAKPFCVVFGLVTVCIILFALKHVSFENKYQRNMDI